MNRLEPQQAFPYDSRAYHINWLSAETFLGTGEAYVLDFELRRFSGRCAQTDRDLAPGEPFFSTLVKDGADLVRRDYCADAWEGPPEGVLGWWKSHVPDPKSKRIRWAPNDVMLHYFSQAEQQPDKEDLRYVLALLMIRRRIFRLQENETDPQGRQVMILYCPRNENEYRVTVITPAEERAKSIQDELAALLGAGTE